jgi:hypothetical protein
MLDLPYQVKLSLFASKLPCESSILAPTLKRDSGNTLIEEIRNEQIPVAKNKRPPWGTPPKRPLLHNENMKTTNKQ